MEKTKRFFISDVHLSSQNLYDQGSSWFKVPKHTKRLEGFIDKNILGKKNIKDFILLGDIFNTWVCPANVAPPTYEDIFKANTSVIDKFKAIIDDGITLFYINGNHDYDLSAAEISKYIPGIKVAKAYKSGRLHAEHGHRFDEIFNKPDFLSDPAYGRPIGYIISRLVTSFSGSGFGIIDLPTYLDDLMEAAIGSQNLMATIIEGLAERAGMNDESEIIMPNDTTLTIEKAKEKYSKIGEKYSLPQFVRELWSRAALGWQADRLCKREDVNIVVFGHSHKALIDKDFFLTENRIYANSGTWCKSNAYCVEVDKVPNKKISVSLHKINTNGKITKTDKKTL